MKETVIFQCKYKKGAIRLDSAKLPDLNHLKDGWYCIEAEITSKGRIMLNGKEREFCDMRMVLKKRGES